MKSGRIISALLIALLLASCNLPTNATPTVEADRVATEVSLLMTAMPTATLPPAAPTEAPTAAPSATQPAPTATTPSVATASATAASATAASATAASATAASATAASATAAPTIPLTIPSPTVTLAAGDPKSALGPATWQSSLDNSKLFYLYENENTRITHQNGALLLTGLKANGWHGWSLTYSKPSKNFYLEAVLNPQTCSGSDLYGLIFRAANNDSGYFYGVTCDGKFNLSARNFADGTDKELIDTTANSAIQQGANVVNRLGVMVMGDRIGLYANGVLLQEINDATFTKEGNFGAFVAANQTAGFTVRMDEISIWVLPESV